MSHSRKLLLYFVLFVNIINCIFSQVTDSYDRGSNTVRFVSAIFRHGDRTVDSGSLYPKDPHINETYYPIGVGQLTVKGKKREYLLGRMLRKRYDALLSDNYTPDHLEPVSTNMNRTKASLALVLAGMYPPKGNLMEWDDELNWQPIPYNYVEYDEQMYLTIPTYFCPNYAKAYTAFLESAEGKKLQSKYESLHEYLRDSTGLNIQTTLDVFDVHSCLRSQTEWGLNLPEWTKTVWPEKIAEATADGLATIVASKPLRQLSGGFLVKRLVDNMQLKSNDTLVPEGRKMSLYSAHDMNIIYVLAALNLFTPHIVPYGACILVELHEISGQHYVKVLYHDYTEPEPRALTIPGCEQLCQLDKFENLLKDNFPASKDPCGPFDQQFVEKNAHKINYYKGRHYFRDVVGRYKKWVRDTSSKFSKAVIGIDITKLPNPLDKIPNPLDKIPNPLDKISNPLDKLPFGQLRKPSESTSESSKQSTPPKMHF